MFIVWRQKPVTSNRKAELFVDYFPHTRLDDAGNVLARGNLRAGSMDRAAWKPLFCEHRGPGRTALTPLLVVCRRVDGVPRQKVIKRLPTIRTCCINDALLRAAWWHEVDELMAMQAHADNAQDKRLPLRDLPGILEALAGTVPRPTAEGERRFRRHVRASEARQAEKWEAQRRAQQQADAEEWRRLQAEADEAERRAAERDRLFEELLREARAWRGGSRQTGATAGWWVTLRLPPTATLEEIKKRFHDLAMKHHPDRGGDPEVFKRVNAAYEEATGQCARRR